MSAKVTVTHVEVERSDAVLAADASKLHAAGDPFRGVVPHSLDCSPRLACMGAPRLAVEGNVPKAKVIADYRERAMSVRPGWAAAQGEKALFDMLSQ